MKRTTRILFLTFGVLGALLMSHGVQASDQQPAEDNAAVYYRKAAQSWQKPSNIVLTEAGNIVKYGWNSGQGDAEKYLFQNKQCLDEIMMAAGVKDCDFSFGGKTDFAETADFNLFKLVELNKFLLLNARYFQKQKEADKAVEICLASFSFARHIAQGKGILYKIVSLSLEAGASDVLKTCIGLPLLTGEEKNKMRRYLQEYWHSHYTLADFIQEARDEFLFTVEKLAPSGNPVRGIQLFSSDKDPLYGSRFYARHKEYLEDVDFSREISRRAYIFAKYYYDPLIEAARRDEAGNDIKQLTQDLKTLERKLAPEQENVFVLFIKTGWFKLQGREKTKEFLADVIVRQMLFPGISGSNVLPRAIDKYAVLLKERIKLEKALAG
jgi:hypothetical protein